MSEAWWGVVCHHGLLLVPGDVAGKLDSPIFKKLPLPADERTFEDFKRDGCILLGGAEKDKLLLTDSGHMMMPPIRVQIHGDLIEACKRGMAANAVAATHFGPRDPDKPCNQDFAVAVELVVHGKVFTLAVVADGVSARVFWPERASRVAALAALNALHTFVSKPARPDETTLPEQLREAIVAAYKRDQENVGEALSLVFDEEYYRRHRGKSENWYQTTLLAAVLGGDGGFVVCSGDGAVARVRNGVFEQKMETDERLDIDTVVSLVMSPQDLAQNFLFDDGGEQTVLLATDGVDRTVATAQGYERAAYFDRLNRRLSECSPGSLRKALFDEVSQLAALPDCTKDNFSIAWLRTPTTQKKGAALAKRALIAAPPPPPPTPLREPPQNQTSPSAAPIAPEPPKIPLAEAAEAQRAKAKARATAKGKAKATRAGALYLIGGVLVTLAAAAAAVVAFVPGVRQSIGAVLKPAPETSQASPTEAPDPAQPAQSADELLQVPPDPQEQGEADASASNPPAPPPLAPPQRPAADQMPPSPQGEQTR